ncbi:MAG: hypothetical protein U9N83_04605 [Thermodesulfobacteriota bacterium]|nr:hypothetical protein [Thermodesulfobacteriota bacterium]
MTSKHLTEKISIYALIISIISIGVTSMFSIKQCNFENKLHKLHIDPTLDYYLVRSIDKKSLEFYLKNKSPIPVVNLSVSHKSFDFYSKLKKYVVERPAVSSILDSPGQNWIFKQKVEPNESICKKEYQIISRFKFYEGKLNLIVAAIFEITFYRESDMKQFNNKAIFFWIEREFIHIKTHLIKSI